MHLNYFKEQYTMKTELFKYLIAQTILNITADHIITTEVIVNAGAFSKHTKANIEDHNIP